MFGSIKNIYSKLRQTVAGISKETRAEIVDTLTIVFLFFIIFFIYIFVKVMSSPVNDHAKFLDYASSLRTGDVILSSYSSLYATIVRLYAGTPWTHTALVVRTGPNPYDIKIVEMNYYQDDDNENEIGATVYKNLLILPFEKWVKLNCHKNDYMGLIKRKFDPDSDIFYDPNESERVLQIANKFVSTKMNLNPVKWWTTLVKFRYNPKEETSSPPTEVFCAELVCRILQESGLIQKIHKPYCYRPDDFKSLPEFDSKIYILRMTKEVSYVNNVKNIRDRSSISTDCSTGVSTSSSVVSRLVHNIDSRDRKLLFEPIHERIGTRCETLQERSKEAMQERF